MSNAAKRIEEYVDTFCTINQQFREAGKAFGLLALAFYDHENGVVGYSIRDYATGELLQYQAGLSWRDFLRLVEIDDPYDYTSFFEINFPDRAAAVAQAKAEEQAKAAEQAKVEEQAQAAEAAKSAEPSAVISVEDKIATAIEEASQNLIILELAERFIGLDFKPINGAGPNHPMIKKGCGIIHRILERLCEKPEDLKLVLHSLTESLKERSGRPYNAIFVLCIMLGLQLERE